MCIGGRCAKHKLCTRCRDSLELLAGRPSSEIDTVDFFLELLSHLPSLDERVVGLVPLAAARVCDNAEFVHNQVFCNTHPNPDHWSQ